MSSTIPSWETVIGLEIHIQLNTATKAFCADEAKFSMFPNTQTSIVSLAHPGTLPKPNYNQVKSAVSLGIAMESQINTHSYFERKQYFYPDLPKGYQISQQASPICIGGKLVITTSQGDKTITLHHIHMEEDAGKSIHDNDPIWSRIDLNRAGVPLLEMVTEPDFRNAEEVSVFLTDLQRLVRYLDISDANMEEGSMRCDVNVSVRPTGSDELRERCEIKNVNSRRFARKALEYEAQRQIAIWESGNSVVRQTMQFIPEEGITSPIRQKESAHDYRYFPDPDLPPIIITASQLNQWKEDQTPLPQHYFNQLILEKKLSVADATVLIDQKETVEYYLSLTRDHPNISKLAANWIIQTILPHLREKNIPIEQLSLSKEFILQLLTAIGEKKITIDQAQQFWSKAIIDNSLSLGDLLQSKSPAHQPDSAAILDEVFQAFPEETLSFKNGKKKLLGFFIGEIKKRYPNCNIHEIQKMLAQGS